MQGDQGPISVKERLARFEKFAQSSNQGSSPTAKPSSNNKPAPPPPVQPKPIIITQPNPSPPRNNNNSGGVESPTVVKPSAYRQSLTNNTNNIASQIPMHFTGPQPIKPTPTVTTQSNEKPSSGQGVQQARLSHKALKQLMQGKIQQFGAPSFDSYNNRSSQSHPPVVNNNNDQKKAPQVLTNENQSVKNHVKNLNQFFLQQKERQNAKAEEELAKKQAQLQQKQETNPQPTKTQEYQQSNTQNISGTNDFFVAPPEMAQQPPKVEENAGNTNQGNDLMTRLKRKKMTKQQFSSDED